MAITRDDVTTAIQRLLDPTRRIDKGDGANSPREIMIRIHQPGDSLTGSVTAAATELLALVDSKNEIRFVPSQGNGLFVGSKKTVEAALNHIAQNRNTIAQEALSANSARVRTP